MEAGLRTPLLDFFRRGEVARDVRLLAAQGAIAPRPLEQLGLLMVLTGDPESEIRETAERTLRRIPDELISCFIARSDVPTELRQFFVARGIGVAATPLPDAEQPFVDDDDTDYDAGASEDTASVMQRLASMTIRDKIKAAMKGTREMRALLIRDPNKLVALSVLSSPKLTDSEVETFARMGSVTEDVLRTIAQRRAWVKNYGVVLGLVKNSKTPLAMTLTLLNRLNEADVRRLSKDRNVPDALRLAARRKLSGD